MLPVSPMTDPLMQSNGLHPSFDIPRVALFLGLGSLAGLFVHTVVKAQSAQPSPRTTIFENVTLSPDFTPDPMTVRGISGGPLSASNLAGQTETTTGPCNGFVDEQPDHTMELTEYFSYLSLEVQSPEDTTMVVRGPGGIWCNDDYSGKDPGIAGQWLSGTYEIWIGSYAQDTYHPYVVRISRTRDGQATP